MPLKKLDELTLIVKEWISDNQEFIEGHQLETLIHPFMPELYYLFCSIKTTNDIDMQVIDFICE
jgi:hypothetical protein